MTYYISLTKRKGLKLEVTKLRRKRNETRNNMDKKKVKMGESEEIGVGSLINSGKGRGSAHPPPKKTPKGNIKVYQNPTKSTIENCVS